jgi:energy-coupling factor transport system ATP-binding protein
MSIRLEHVDFIYMKGTPYEKQALSDVSLTIKKGEFVAVIGHTGSGKSTLVQHLNGLLVPTQGKVFIEDVDLAGKDPRVKACKQMVGMVFQYPEHQIFAETVFEDIAFGPRNKGMSVEEVERQVREAMEFVGLDYDTYAQRSPFQLSGGQMRRVAIAGVVAMDPDYLILDEPSAGLDPGAKEAIFERIMKLYQARKIAIILVTHSMEEAARYAKRILVMNKSKILLDGETKEIFLKHREELRKASLDIPQTVQLVDLLRQGGLKLPEGLLTEAAVVAAIKKVRGLH